jgi:hypothetical protein
MINPTTNLARRGFAFTTGVDGSVRRRSGVVCSAVLVRSSIVVPFRNVYNGCEPVAANENSLMIDWAPINAKIALEPII